MYVLVKNLWSWLINLHNPGTCTCWGRPSRRPLGLFVYIPHRAIARHACSSTLSYNNHLFSALFLFSYFIFSPFHNPILLPYHTWLETLLLLQRPYENLLLFRSFLNFKSLQTISLLKKVPIDPLRITAILSYQKFRIAIESSHSRTLISSSKAFIYRLSWYVSSQSNCSCQLNKLVLVADIDGYWWRCYCSTIALPHQHAWNHSHRPVALSR